jgi:hypothetical protein
VGSSYGRPPRSNPATATKKGFDKPGSGGAIVEEGDTVRNSSEELVEIPGQDSFLDVITNIVGILILLVLIVGIKTSRSIASAAGAADAGNAAVTTDAMNLDRARVAATAEANGFAELVVRVRDVESTAAMRDAERNMLTTFVAAAEHEIAERRSRLTQEQQREFDLRRKIADAQQVLDELTVEQVSMVAQESQPEIVEALPTPLAKTVTGEEIHLRLAAGRVAVVPIDKLHEEAEPLLERNVWRLREYGEMEGIIGPIDGFRMRYQVRLEQVAVPGRAGYAMTQPVVDQRYEYVPEMPDIGESIDDALLPTSSLRQTLKSKTTRNTTVTIWTYPDSFANFRRLKKALFDLGFAAAGRPLPMGQEIASSPSGTKSAAQ